jgi:hypothetical protein
MEGRIMKTQLSFFQSAALIAVMLVVIAVIGWAKFHYHGPNDSGVIAYCVEQAKNFRKTKGMKVKFTVLQFVGDSGDKTGRYVVSYQAPKTTGLFICNYDGHVFHVLERH